MSAPEITAEPSVEIAESEPLSYAVVEAVADAEGVAKTELDPLYGAIDPDRLDALFRPQIRGPDAPDVAAEIRFSYHGYEVRANAAGHVNLTDQ